MSNFHPAVNTGIFYSNPDVVLSRNDGNTMTEYVRYKEHLSGEKLFITMENLQLTFVDF